MASYKAGTWLVADSLTSRILPRTPGWHACRRIREGAPSVIVRCLEHVVYQGQATVPRKHSTSACPTSVILCHPEAPGDTPARYILR